MNKTIKGYIKRDTLLKIINKHTVFSKAKDVPNDWKWYSFDDGSFLTWDFTVMDRVLIDVEIPQILQKQIKRKLDIE